MYLDPNVANEFKRAVLNLSKSTENANTKNFCNELLVALTYEDNVSLELK